MRKFLIALLTIIAAILLFMQKQFQLALNAQEVAAAGMAAVIYLFGEAKNDFERIKIGLFQQRKWADPAFWTAFIATILPVINETFGLSLPVKEIVAVVSAILAFIFASRQKKLKSA